MEEAEKRDNKKLFIILSTIGALALLVVIILFSVNSDENPDLSTLQPVRQSKKDTIVVRRVVTIMKGSANEKVYTTEQFVDNKKKNAEPAVQTSIPTPTSTPIEKAVAPPVEDNFDAEYEKSLQQYTIADVPAKPRPERVEPKPKADTTDLEEVLMASELAVQMKEQKSLWQSFKDRIASFFGYGDEPEAPVKQEKSSVVKEMLTELNAEIMEMQPRFVSYHEDNDITYIDHINRPSGKGTKGFYIYIGVAPNGFTFHRTVIRYSGEKKIGLQKVLLQTATSDKAIIIDALEIAQYNDTDEWIDLAPTQENNELLNAVTSSDDIKITFMGRDGNGEWVLSPLEVNTLRESLHFYNLLKEREELLLN